jgi:Trypsin-like peptidase domain
MSRACLRALSAAHLSVSTMLGLLGCAADPANTVTSGVSGSAVISNQVNLSASDIESVASKARQFTVYIYDAAGGATPRNGSGVIGGHVGLDYTVYTNAHVMNAVGATGKLRTPDGTSHSYRILRNGNSASFDVAVLVFSSANNYKTATFRSTENLKPLEPVFAAGFPNDEAGRFDLAVGMLVGDGRVGFGLPAPKTCRYGSASQDIRELTAGTVGHYVGIGGYELALCLSQRKGISGGPTLDASGQVIGLNGKHEYPIFGSSEIYRNGAVRPAQREVDSLEQFSWSIPTRRLLENGAGAIVTSRSQNPEVAEQTIGDEQISGNSTPMESSRSDQDCDWECPTQSKTRQSDSGGTTEPLW